MSASPLPLGPLVGSGYDDWCAFCGVNPVYEPGDTCSGCRAEEEFLNCEHCHGTECDRSCEDDEDLT